MPKVYKSLGNVLFIGAVSGVLTGCGSMGGHGPSASDIRSEGSGYHLIEVTNVSQIPSADNSFSSSPAPPSDSGNQYLEELTPRDQLEFLITDASSPSSPFYREGGSYTYGPVEVPRSGMIKIPYVGDVSVLGKSLAEVSKEVSEKVKAVAASAEVTITRPYRLQKRANVLGDVREPGPVEIDRRGFTFLDVLAAAGGPNGAEHLYYMTLQRNGKEYRYDANTLRSQLIKAEDGDLIRVVKDPDKHFIVSGAVNRPGKYDFPAESPTLADALAYGAGLNEHRSNPHGVFVFRNRGSEQENAYAIDMKQANSAYLASRFPVEGGDTIYVSEAPLTQWNRFIGTVLPFGQAAKMGATAATGLPVP